MDPSALVAEAFKLTVVPACRQLEYMLRYKIHVNELKDGVDKLVHARKRVQHAINEAILKGERIEGDVQRWLSETDVLTKRARKVIVDVESKKSCLHFIPNPVARHQLGRKARKDADNIRDHCRSGEKFNKISYHDAQTTEAAATLPSSSSGTTAQPPIPLDSRASILSKIMEALEDNNVRRIGVHGMGGVGKSTLLDEVERKAKESNRFDEVIRKLISKNPNVDVIGADISYILGMLDKKDDGKGSAEQDGTGSGKKKAFIILDDLWEDLNLKLIGIEDSYKNVEIKMLLTSRNCDLLANKIGCRPNLHLTHLSPEETAKLFAAIAGRDPQTDTLAANLVEKCKGLPVLIVPLATMLKNKAFFTWEEAVEHIKKLEAGYSTLELSYQSLEEEKYKELFLLCGLMGNQNIPVRNLLKYSIGLGSFGGTNIVERAGREMVESIRKLQASSLLLQGDDNDHVKIHDVVREFSTKIANKDGRYLVFSDDKDLQVCPVESLEKITTISLPHVAIQTLPQHMWSYPNLTTFISHAGDYANDQGMFSDSPFGIE
ncbi:probable disease resistance protein At1g61300 [Punica granatum]|uniref:Probable disease resistance protein At1g61300 n=1 Tax=Punica granatum TaxID=22663 RepID=A0A6P8EC25_PUNGR|nr:probable disease resistance protein At1g61300 [Punica granatum]